MENEHLIFFFLSAIKASRSSHWSLDDKVAFLTKVVTLKKKPSVFIENCNITKVATFPFQDRAGKSQQYPSTVMTVNHMWGSCEC